MSDITIEPYTVSDRSYTSFIHSSLNNRINIWTDSATAEKIKNSTSVKDGVSGKYTYEHSDNCYYNTAYNLYIYTNAVFA